jgi:hypothetical protein
MRGSVAVLAGRLFIYKKWQKGLPVKREQLFLQE